MSTQQSDAEFIETIDYEEPVEQEPEPVADICPDCGSYSICSATNNYATINSCTGTGSPISLYS
jgi:hypothetical protein